jgi:HAD superfamily hydrolase (TIGR01509 family)
MDQIITVIFDLDGLMIDSEPLQWRAMNIALKPLGLQISGSEWIRMVGKKTIENLQLLKNTYGFEEDLSYVEHMKNKAYRNIIRQEVTPMPGLYHALETCQKARLRLALASSSVQEDIEIILNKLGLKQTFDVIVSGDQVRQGKPDPEIFLKAAFKLNVVPSQCVVLEDTAYGVAAAKEASMSCIAVPNRFTKHQDFGRADLVLDSLYELDLDTLKTL